MKVVFEKDETGSINSKLQIDGKLHEFSYSNFIERLVIKEKLEPPEFIGAIDKDDEKKLCNLIDEIISSIRLEEDAEAIQETKESA